MKKILSITSVVLFLLAIIIGSFIVSNINDKNKKVTVRYLATEGGEVRGETTQTGYKGMNTKTVVAIPNEGYYFAYWDDNAEISKERAETNVKKDITVTAVFENITFSVNYHAGSHGRIEGETKQTVIYARDSVKVTAIADEGYEFSGWSDGIETAERQDSFIMQDINVTACFGKIEKVFTLNYKFGEAEENISEILLDYDNLHTTILPVPHREHFTFDGWYLRDSKVADNQGKLSVNKEVFDEHESEIYAKWTANETFTYKILLVYITEFNADLTTMDGSMVVSVNYKMSDFERAVCGELTKQTKLYLDDLLDGLVEFQVDEYYTAKTVGIDSIYNGYIGKGKYTNAIYPGYIKEIQEKLDKYQSIFSVFSFEDYDYKFHNSAGLADRRLAMIHFDSMLTSLYAYNNKIWDINKLSEWFWEYQVDTVIHELIHTIELRIHSYNYHKFLSKNIYMRVLYLQKLYFHNEGIVDGEKIGIPYNFWAEDQL